MACTCAYALLGVAAEPPLCCAICIATSAAANGGSETAGGAGAVEPEVLSLPESTLSAQFILHERRLTAAPINVRICLHRSMLPLRSAVHQLHHIVEPLATIGRRATIGGSRRCCRITDIICAVHAQIEWICLVCCLSTAAEDMLTALIACTVTVERRSEMLIEWLMMKRSSTYPLSCC